MPSIFTKIVQGDIPAYTIAETEDFLAFLDINPLTKGHTLVIPKVEVDLIFDLPEDVFQRLFLFAKSVAEAMSAVLTCERIGMSVIGLEVPHAHIHLIPIRHIGDMDFGRPKLSLDQNEMEKIAASIRDAMML